MTETISRITRRTALALAAAAAFAPAAAFAQASYPAKTITFVCGFPAGSGADVLVRYFAEKVAAVSGATIIVENKLGAAGGIAAEYTARSQPDGHTIFVHSGNAIAGSMSLMKNPPVDAAKDLQTIATINKQAFMLTVRADSPHQNVADLVEALKQKGTSALYAFNAPSGRVLGAEFNLLAGLNAEPVQYASAPDSVNDMMAGHVDFGAHDPVFALSQMREGRWRALAIGSGERMKGIPDVPTFKEQGYEIDQLGWWGVMVPAAVPADVVGTINGWFNEVLSQADTQEFLTRQGGDVFVSTPAEAQQWMVDSITEWSRLINLAGIEPQ